MPIIKDCIQKPVGWSIHVPISTLTVEEAR